MLDISVLMWYIMVRKDESNVLRKTPAPDAHQKTKCEEPRKAIHSAADLRKVEFGA